MEPEIFAPGGVQGKAVVLGVVAPHQDLESIRGGKAQKVRRFLPLIPLLVIFQVSLAFQLCPDLPQSYLTGSGLHFVEHRFQVGDLLFAFCQQIHQHTGGSLLLFVIFEVVLGVLAGGVAQVQRNGHFVAFIVPVGHGDAGHPLLCHVEVGRKQLSVQAQLLAFAAGGQLVPPGCLLAQRSVVHIMDGFMQLLAFGAQPLGPVLFRIVAIQQSAETGPPAHLVGFAVLLRHKKGIFHRTAIRRSNAAGGAPRLMLCLELVDGLHQLLTLRLGQLTGQQLLPGKCTPGSLPADHRPHTGCGFVQRIRHRQLPGTGRRHDGCSADREEIRPGGLGRNGIGQAGQQLPHLAILKIHPLECIQDLAVLHQHQVGVPAHQLCTEDVVHQVPHLVGTKKFKIHDPVTRLHPHIQQPSAGQMLAHQHTEGGRGLRVFKAFLGQADPGRPAAGRQQQAEGLGAGPQTEHQLIPRRLKYFCDLGVGQGRFQLRCRQRQCRSVQCHVGLPHPI